MQSWNYIPDVPAERSDFQSSCVAQFTPVIKTPSWHLIMADFVMDDANDFFHNQNPQAYLFEPKPEDSTARGVTVSLRPTLLKKVVTSFCLMCPNVS